MVTIKEIADEAGVSISTVSRILNADKSLQVSAQTRQKVLEVASKLKYIKPNSKKSVSAGNILITHWYTDEMKLGDLYYSSIRWGVETTLKNANYHIIRSIFNEDFSDFFDFSEVDGIIAIGGFDKYNLSKLLMANKPLVIINQNTIAQGVSCITADYTSPVKKIVDYFKEQNHTKIGLIDGISNSNHNRHSKLDPRSIAFHQIAKQENVFDEKLIFTGNFSLESGYQAMKTAIEVLGDDLPTAFFVINDVMAIGALRALSEAKISVPDRVSLIGFGDVEVGSFLSPSLSTVQLAQRQMGTLGAMTLQNIINGIQTEPINIVTSTKLILRETTR